MRIQNHLWVILSACALLVLFGWRFTQDGQPLPNSYIGKEVSVILAAMPKYDRNKLEWYFREALGWSQFGYVLLGEKPMALDVIAQTLKPFESYSRFRFAMSPRRMQIQSGYKTWNKYKKFFPMPNFVILEEREKDNLLVFLINKNIFIEKINQNKNDFEIILQRTVTGEMLLDESASKPLFKEILANHDGLIGIVLGYGRDNAFFYHQKSQLLSEQDQLEFLKENHLDSVWTDTEFSDFCKKFESVSWISEYISGAHMKNLELMALPGFVAQQSSIETEALRLQYLEAKAKIIDYYTGKDFLETTLHLLTSTKTITQP